VIIHTNTILDIHNYIQKEKEKKRKEKKRKRKVESGTIIPG